MVLRKYTPPTCTLEINAKESPLSRWAGRSVLKQVRFELRFDDPRQPDEKRVSVWGDRTQLEALCEAVTTYVQDFLNKSPEQLPIAIPSSSHLNLEVDNFESEIQPIPASVVNPFQMVETATEQQSEISERRNFAPEQATIGTNPLTIYLQPRSLLAHDLFLGSLQTEESGSIVSLSTLQLFDLATALDECAAEIAILPEIDRPVWRTAMPPWAKAAAMVLLTVGVTATAVKLIDRYTTDPETATLPPSTPTAQEGGVAPTEQTPIAQGSPAPTPPETATSVPTPPPLTSPAPTDAAPTPGANALTSSLPPPPAIVPLPPPSSPPPLVIPEKGKVPSRAKPEAPLFVTPEKATAPPLSAPPPPDIFRTDLTPPPSSLPPAIGPQIARSKPRPSVAPIQRERGLRQPQAATPPEKPAPDPPTPSATPSIAALPPAPRLSSKRPEKVESPEGETSPFRLNSNPAASPNSEVSRDRALSDAAPPAIGATRGLPSSAQSNPIAPPQERDKTPSDSVASGRIFDLIPQVAEVRNYFQQRWKAPESLTKPIEYHLLLKADGTIDRIIPLGAGAGTYIDRTGMPLPGEPFVSAIEGGRTPTIRLVLYPDNKVETLLLEPTK